MPLPLNHPVNEAVVYAHSPSVGASAVTAYARAPFRGKVIKVGSVLYGAITLLDFPQFTKDTFPGVTRMDIFSGLFGEAADDSMYVDVPLTVGAATRVTQEFDPSSASGKRWLEKMANKMVTTGTHCQHISNNAPRDICDPDVEKRRAGIAVAKRRTPEASTRVTIKMEEVNLLSGWPNRLPRKSYAVSRLPL